MTQARPWRRWADRPFFAALIGLSSLYLLLIVAMLAADVWYAGANVSGAELSDLIHDENIAYSVKLTLFSCTVTAILSLIVAVPAGYLLSRYQFKGKTLVDAILDIPIVLPPLVVGLSLLILFNKMPPFPAEWGWLTFEEMAETTMRWLFPAMKNPGVTYSVSGVILAQFSVACAFAVRTMRNTFDQISPRTEQVALTLGCSRARAFFAVVVPEAWRGVSTAGTLSWTRSMGEFGPILVFAGSTRGRTEVMSSTVFLEFSVGALERAVVVSLAMVTIAVIVLVAVRMWDGERK